MCGHAEYLGVVVGLTATRASRWSKARRKMEDRLAAYAASTMAPSLTVRRYNTYCASIPVYVAQVVEAPEDVRALEVRHAERLLRFPHHAIPPAAWPALHHMGVPSIRLVGVVMEAAMLRSAMAIHDRVTAAAGRLAAARMRCGALATLAADAPSAERTWWGDAACVDGLMAARQRAGELATRLAAARGGDAGELALVPSGAALRRELEAARGIPRLQDALLPRLCRWALLGGGLLREMGSGICVVGGLRSRLPHFGSPPPPTALRFSGHGPSLGPPIIVGVVGARDAPPAIGSEGIICFTWWSAPPCGPRWESGLASRHRAIAGIFWRSDRARL